MSSKQAEQSILLLAELAGLAHDLGKASKHFQQKLESASSQGTFIKDETRHEWISTKLYQALRQNSYNWERAWTVMAKDRTRYELPFQLAPHQHGLRSLLDVVDFAILTHHGLLGPKERTRCGANPDKTEHTKRAGGEGRLDVWKSAGRLPAPLLKHLKVGTAELEALNQGYGEDHLGWQGMVLIVRASLILADHEVSSHNKIQPKKQGRLYANTHKDAKGKTKLNQPLEWHLSTVAERSKQIVGHFLHPDLPGISLQSRKVILQPSLQPRFHWQNEATEHLQQFTKNNVLHPTLVFNTAGTGSGKTLMNAKALAALCPDTEPLRIAAGFNLRTLTLQTHSALKQMLSLKDNEISCVIGDRLSKVMHEQEIDEDEQEEIEIETHGEECALPVWLQEWVLRKANLQDLVGSPILVSTMDYLVKAGQPSTQGHHGHALLRIASSDLILDEVDSYDPAALVAVLRVVQMSALFGKNVIASSATLSHPIAEALLAAYASGIEMCRAINRTVGTFRVSCIDDVLKPASQLVKQKDSPSLMKAFQQRRPYPLRF